jgi:tetratricopeptide (TPR) repeat protein
MTASLPDEKARRAAWRAILAAHDKAGSPIALAAADEALALDPDDLEFLAAKGRQLILLRRFAEAEACLDQALRRAPDHVTGRLHQAQLYVIQGRYEEAQGLIEGAVAVDGGRQLTLVRAGRLLQAMGRHLEASRLLGQAMASGPEPSLRAHHEAALAGLAEDAEAGAEPGDKAALQRAREQLRRGLPARAEPLFAALVRERPGFAPGWIGLRGALEAQGRHGQAQALKQAWISASPSSAPAAEIGMGRRLGGRGLVFDPRDRFPIRRLAEATRQARRGADLLEGEDACLVLDSGGAPVTYDPVVSLDGVGDDRLGVSYRTAPKHLVSLRNAALVGEGVVLNQAGELISELIPPSKPSKYAGVSDGGWMSFDPMRFHDGMGAVRLFDRPALLMCGPTDASFGDWIINFPPRLAFAEAAGLDDLAIVLRRPPQAQALDILAALGVTPERILFHDPDGVSLFSRLIVPSWPTPAKLAPSAGVYDIYRRLAPRTVPAERPRLYLTRKNVASRQMVNEDEVRDLFERRGFRAVDPGSLTFAQVRELFAGPACVAGPFGSAFHNLAFSAGQPVSLVLLPDHTRRHLEEIALWHGDLGLRFGYLWGPSLPGDGAGAKGRHAPWIAPLDRLNPAIDAILDLAAKA